jgi:hypothetical protein
MEDQSLLVHCLTHLTLYRISPNLEIDQLALAVLSQAYRQIWNVLIPQLCVFQCYILMTVIYVMFLVIFIVSLVLVLDQLQGKNLKKLSYLFKKSRIEENA